jgi:leader peptidase (prepilin peptidase)/N-methyltransferase
MTEALLFASIAAALGLLIGSFLNVCVSRLADDYSVVEPRSQCPRCASLIAWYDNIPLLSFVFLGGRCRRCRFPISLRYPLLELLTAALFFWIVFRLGPGWPAIKWCVFSAIVLELIFSDAETLILPDEFTKGGTVLGLIFAAIVPLPFGIFSWAAQFSIPSASPALLSFLNASLTAALLSGGLWLLGALYQRFRGREGLGFGDVKMVACLGAFLGLEACLLGLMIGSLAGSVLGLFWIRFRRAGAATFELPFGSFLGAGALLAAATLL